MKFTKKQFIETIEAIKGQLDYDKNKTESIEVNLKAQYELEDLLVGPYDNSRLTNQIFKLLHSQFPPSNEGCKIQQYCFDHNFERGSISDLWEELLKEKELV
ncbi:hypothetical protein SAMN04489761_4310 [Tenacibaculum sp. MAR_2009_124]|uniref:hypothetical protein n=1 Tax=Tenacibaculum sp. MAR_2009_124 TaxID=1250059 RepID=UPI0008950385|nr:hypothetical protein [Tenacibaculum sp. MAR_2009_124]SED11168.1 hypothetical protein SAMN04489761_4310 [Tenacibaculum sp. MAR_2009_124]